MDLCPVFPPHFREQHVPSGEGRDLVNGYQPAEEVLYETYRDNESGIKYPVTLAEDEYFILNDYRDDTADSRAYGPIKASAIKGKVIFLLRRRGF